MAAEAAAKSNASANDRDARTWPPRRRAVADGPMVAASAVLCCSVVVVVCEWWWCASGGGSVCVCESPTGVGDAVAIARQLMMGERALGASEAKTLTSGHLQLTR